MGRADGGGLGRHPAPVAPEAVQRVLHDGHGMQLHDAGAGGAECRQVVAELEPQVRLPKGDVPAPADASIDDIGAAQVCDSPGIVGERGACREMNLARRRPQLLLDPAEESLHHGPLEGAGPVGGRGVAFLVRVLVHVEAVQVIAGEAQLVDEARGDGILRHGSHGENAHQPPALLAGPAEPPHDVLRKLLVELRAVFDHPDAELGVRMAGDVGPPDGPRAGTGGTVAEGDERREVVVESGHGS